MPRRHMVGRAGPLTRGEPCRAAPTVGRASWPLDERRAVPCRADGRAGERAPRREESRGARRGCRCITFLFWLEMARRHHPTEPTLFILCVAHGICVFDPTQGNHCRGNGEMARSEKRKRASKRKSVQRKNGRARGPKAPATREPAQEKLGKNTRSC